MQKLLQDTRIVCLPGDSPEMMPLDRHLFADLKVGAARYVAITFHLTENDEEWALKYSFATSAKVFQSLQRTIAEGCPSNKRMSQDVNRIFEETLGRILGAKGCFIKITQIISSETAYEGWRKKSTSNNPFQLTPMPWLSSRTCCKR
jgi:hypothetical protein